VIDWSYDLLAEPERLLFARLGVFAAEFDLTAAEAVAADERLPAAQIAHLVALLADRSMLTRPGHAGIGRYRMLDTLRAYAATRLSAQELTQTRHAHARHLVELAEEADIGLTGPDEAAAAERITAWLDDARAAFHWAHDTGETDLALRLVAALARWAYWRMHPDVLAWAETLVDAAPDHPLPPAAYAAAAAGIWLTGRLEQAQALARRAVETAGGLAALGAAAPLELGLVCAFCTILKSADVPTQVPSQSDLDNAPLGGEATPSGELLEAVSAYRELTAVTAPHTVGRATGLAAVAIALVDLNDPAAWPTAREAVAQALASGNPTALAYARLAEARTAAAEDPAAALAALDEARAVAAEVGCRLISASALTVAVALRGRHGPPDEALALFHEAIGPWRTTGNQTLLVALLSNLVLLLARTGRDVEAVDLAATLRHAVVISSIYSMYGAERERIDAALAAARRRLGAQRYDAAWSVGAQRDVDEAVERAQQLLAEHATTTQPRSTDRILGS
jgi:hypothetical protein